MTKKSHKNAGKSHFIKYKDFTRHTQTKEETKSFIAYNHGKNTLEIWSGDTLYLVPPGTGIDCGILNLRVYETTK